jgi:7,8-dihydropterin-6-yl-methyl-4-(beta-D-ribofuranosyl)aminobenzene 5'-phosphate synthase
MKALPAFFAAAALFASAQTARDRIVILYDSNAAPPLSGGWGYSAFVLWQGKRILFDAGGNADSLAKNARALGVDLARLDAVVISHDDPDHYAGLSYVYSVNPNGKVYVPEQDLGAFSPSLLNRLLRSIEGAMPGRHVVDAPVGPAYVRVPASTTILPGARLVQLPFDRRREHALVLETRSGLVLLTGCAHPGVEKFVQAAGGRVQLLAGGFHLVDASPDRIRRTVAALRKAGVGSVYAGHCTGRQAIEELRKQFGARAGMVGVGGTIPVPE